MTKEVERAIEEAQLVLVGLGTEWETPADRWKENPLYASLAAQTEGSGPFEQYLCFHDLEHNPDLEKKKAYQKLGQLLQGKNYFIVSLCRDDLIYGSGLDEGRIVTPCGGFRALQCENGCPLCGESGLLKEEKGMLSDTIYNDVDRNLRLKLLELDKVILMAFEDCKPNYIADYIYQLSDLANSFYQNNHLANLEDENKKNDWLYVLTLTNKVLKELLFLIGIEIPTFM